jgi:outer membrane protein
MRITLITLITFILSSCAKEKIAYINTQVVFNEFEYKKELEKELESIQNQRKYVLDSMQTNLKMLSKKYNLDKKNKNIIVEYQTARELFLEKKTIIEEEAINMIKTSDEKIIKQINSYLIEYGKEEKYKIIFGTTLNGSIMYGDTTLDISKKVITYINSKYRGSKSN